MTARIPTTVFVPFSWDGSKWIKRDDVPRFKEPAEALQWAWENPHAGTHEGQPTYLHWVECHEPAMIKEFLRGVGTTEWLTLRH